MFCGEYSAYHGGSPQIKEVIGIDNELHLQTALRNICHPKQLFLGVEHFQAQDWSSCFLFLEFRICLRLQKHGRCHVAAHFLVLFNASKYFRNLLAILDILADSLVLDLVYRGLTVYRRVLWVGS